jgi:hypothetical protein
MDQIHRIKGPGRMSLGRPKGSAKTACYLVDPRRIQRRISLRWAWTGNNAYGQTWYNLIRIHVQPFLSPPPTSNFSSARIFRSHFATHRYGAGGTNVNHTLVKDSRCWVGIGSDASGGGAIGERCERGRGCELIQGPVPLWCLLH